jgi:hypothetical protein
MPIKVKFSIGDIKNRDGEIKSYYGDGQYWIFDGQCNHLVDKSGITCDYAYKCRLQEDCTSFKSEKCNVTCVNYV